MSKKKKNKKKSFDKKDREKENGKSSIPDNKKSLKSCWFGKCKKLLKPVTCRERNFFVAETVLFFVFLAIIFALRFGGGLMGKIKKELPLGFEPLDIDEPVWIDEDLSAVKLKEELEVARKIALEQAQKADTAKWKAYVNQYYGFSVKHPPSWGKVMIKKPTATDGWEWRYEFRKINPEATESFIGFDLTVYNTKKTGELRNTKEFPKLKEGVSPEADTCQSIEGHLTENPDFPAEEISIPPGDDCYNPVFFYNLTRNEYIYNLTPVYAEGVEKEEDLKNQTLASFGDFFTVAANWQLIDIVRPKPKPKITAPRPVSAKIVNGKMVCAKKNDKPRKSKQDKGHHLDMECCLDPDEDPNPWCTY